MEGPPLPQVGTPISHLPPTGHIAIVTYPINTHPINTPLVSRHNYPTIHPPSPTLIYTLLSTHSLLPSFTPPWNPLQHLT